MASNLAAALLGGGGNEAAMLGLDPALAAPTTDLQLGSSLMQGGLSTEPAYPMQALARLAQTLAGVSLQRGAVSDLAKVYAQSTANAAATLPDGALKSALLSNDPLVRMQGWQAYQKGLTLLTQPENLAPGHRTAIGAGQENPNYRSPDAIAEEEANRMAGARAAPGQPQAPQPGLRPQVPLTPPAAGATGDVLPRGEQPIVSAPRVPATSPPAHPITPDVPFPAVAAQKAAEAAAEAKAKAPFESGGTGTVVDNQGRVQEVPITAAERATAAAARASGPITPTRVSTTSITQGPQGQTVTQPTATPTVGGKPLPNTTADQQHELDAKEVEADREKASQGQGDMATVRMIQDFLPKVRTGWSADTKLDAARILQGLPESVRPSPEEIQKFVGTDVASGQILQKKFLELSSAAARQLGAREPGSVISMFAKAYPNLGTDEHAIRLQTNAIYMDRLRQQALANDKSNYLNESTNDPNFRTGGSYRGLQGFNEQFGKAHPAENYLSAAEAMSEDRAPWGRVKDRQQQQNVINLIPPGSRFMAPNGKILVKPGAGTQPAPPQ